MSGPTVAYFSMEIGLQADVPTYSGGLGVLAGDMIRAAADAKIPMVAVSLLHRRGYFSQVLDASGWQTEKNEPWPVEQVRERLKWAGHIPAHLERVELPDERMKLRHS